MTKMTVDTAIQAAQFPHAYSKSDLQKAFQVLDKEADKLFRKGMKTLAASRRRNAKEIVEYISQNWAAV